MARFNGPPHPNALAARQTDRARRLATDRVAAREREDAMLAMRERGLTMREISDRTGLPVGTVKSRIWYALRSLRLVLEEMGVTP